MRGIALLVVIWVISLLSMLVIVFLSSSSVEQSVTKNFVGESLAKGLAQSGIEFGHSKIYTTLQRGFFDTSGNLDQYWTTELIESRADGLVKIKIQDLQGKINVNDGVGYALDHSLNKNLERILTILGNQLAVAALGAKLLGQRPVQGFATEYDLERVLRNDYERVRGHITIHSWRNTKVASPVPLSAYEVTNGSYPIKYLRPFDSANQPIYRRGHNKDTKDIQITSPLKFNTDGEGADIYSSAIFSCDTLNPQWIELVSRSPVNVNTATREVLIALITDLQGFYVQERRVPAPPFINIGPLHVWYVTNPSDVFSLAKSGYTYGYNHSPEDQYYLKGTNPKKFISNDHLGILQTTRPFNSTTGINPAVVANEIIACRNRATSETSNINYATHPLGGSLKTWAQFNLFADLMAQANLLSDNRNRFQDIWLDPALQTLIKTQAVQKKDLELEVIATDSPIQKRIAAQAMADVLKANFNPNLNLNEINPNRNFWTLVDKTDLIINSTEFCFLPMGYFRIDSVGEYQVDEKTIAIKKAINAIKLYDVRYETTQKEFYGGTFGDRKNAIKTNNEYAVETGPEIDNGKAPSENEYSGYVTMSTYLGVGFKRPTASKGALVTSYHLPGVYDNQVSTLLPMFAMDGYGSDVHTHFTLDHVAHHHKDMATMPERLLPVGPFDGKFREWKSALTGQVVKESTMNNYADRKETLRAPYSPINLVNEKERYRLCRTFTAGQSGYEYEPSDLRVDGAYFEFNSTIAYHTPFKWKDPWEGICNIGELFETCPDNCQTYLDQLPTQMFISFFVKPNFYPECSERERQFVATNNYGWPGVYEGDGIFLHGFYWLPAYQSTFSTGLPLSILSFPPRFNFVYGARAPQMPDPRQVGWHVHWPLGSWGNSQGFTHYVFGGPMNYEDDVENGNEFNRYYGVDSKYNRFRRNEWIHVMIEAKKEQDNTDRMNIAKQYINMEPFDSGLSLLNYDHRRYLTDKKVISVLQHGPFVSIGGECASAFLWQHLEVTNPLVNRCSPPITRYYYADSTMDEFFLWFNNNTSGYDASERIFNVYGRYYRPIDSDATDGIFTSNALSFNTEAKLLGVSWTVYSEDYKLDTKMTPQFYNYQDNPPSAMLIPEITDSNGSKTPALCLISFLGKNSSGQYVNITDQFGNDGYSNIHWQGQQVLTKDFRYRVKFRLGLASIMNTTLMATPIFEDITIFYIQGPPQVFSYIIS